MKQLKKIKLVNKQFIIKTIRFYYKLNRYLNISFFIILMTLFLNSLRINQK